MAFRDSEMFKFVEMDVDGEDSRYDSGKHLIPIHYRDLGDKEGHMYAKRVSWSDVVINGIPLEKSFEYEDQIQDVKWRNQMADTLSQGGTGFIVVNERKIINIPDDLDDYNSKDYRTEQKRWLNRLKRLGLDPFNYREAKKKKKKSQGRFPVKPKDKRILHPQKQKEFFDDVVIKEEELEELKDCVIRIRTNEYEDATIYIEPNSRNPVGWGPGVTWFKKRIMKNYCPPLHWIKPIVRWDLIWSEMDTIEYGRKRDYHYISPNERDYSGESGPIIYFYDKESTDLNYNFDWYTDYASSPSQYLTSPFPYKE